MRLISWIHPRGRETVIIKLTVLINTVTNCLAQT
jgi:hypothetical protein